MGQLGLFDAQNTLQSLSKQGDPLEKLNKCVKWSIFKPIIVQGFKKERRSNAGRPPFDYLKMFKILVLQELHGLSDNQIQFQLLDRFTFRRFVGIELEDKVPDEKTIWLFRETLTQKGLFDKLFNQFNSFLEKQGFKAEKGMIVDANIVEVPKQRNTREENNQLKDGQTPEDWDENLPKKSQKDTDATWLKKNGKNHFGYKNHICIDNKHKLIRKYAASGAHVHDSEKIFDILDEKNTSQTIYADSAYRSKEIEEVLAEVNVKSRIHKKGYRNKKISEFQKGLNHRKSKIRARVEHVFGRMHSMHQNYLRCIGQLRAANRIGLRNLVYNISRFEFLVRAI